MALVLRCAQWRRKQYKFHLLNNALLPITKLPARFHDHRPHLVRNRGRLQSSLPRGRMLRRHDVQREAAVPVPRGQSEFQGNRHGLHRNDMHWMPGMRWKRNTRHCVSQHHGRHQHDPSSIRWRDCENSGGNKWNLGFAEGSLKQRPSRLHLRRGKL
jgi:hypothetical protein